MSCVILGAGVCVDDIFPVPPPYGGIIGIDGFFVSTGVVTAATSLAVPNTAGCDHPMPEASYQLIDATRLPEVSASFIWKSTPIRLFSAPFIVLNLILASTI